MKFENLKQIIVGGYVCTPIKNAFNTQKQNRKLSKK